MQGDALKSADRALQNARAIGDSPLVEECATVIWNLALPLLQPDTRMAAYRSMFNAAGALQAIASQREHPIPTSCRTVSFILNSMYVLCGSLPVLPFEHSYTMSLHCASCPPISS